MPDFMKASNSLAVIKPEPSSSSASQTAASCSSEMAALGSASILRTISSISGNWMRPLPSSSIFANILNQSCMCGSAPTAISALSILDRSRTASAPAGAMPSKRLLSARPTFSSMSARAAAPAAALSAASFSCHVGPASPCPIFMNLPNMSDLRAPEVLTSRAAHTAVSVSSLMSFFFMPRLPRQWRRARESGAAGDGHPPAGWRCKRLKRARASVRWRWRTHGPWTFPCCARSP